MSAIFANQPIGEMARLGVMRLGASRVAAIADGDNVKDSTGLYEWTRAAVGPVTGAPLADPPDTQLP